MEFKARAVVLTAGTFLSGKIHIGLENYEGGRAGDPSAKSLGGRLRELNLPQGRLKTVLEQRYFDASQKLDWLARQIRHPRQKLDDQRTSISSWRKRCLTR